MSKTITIQFRMTKKCNAECSYCINPFLSAERMSLADFKKSIDYLISSYFKSIGARSGDNVDLEFVGGEVSLLPSDLIKSCSDYARDKFVRAGFSYSNGCQSNFVGSKEKLIALWDIFDGNMSTSVDNFSEHRKLKGSSEYYRCKFKENKKAVTNNEPIRSVFVIDAGGTTYAKQEFRVANKEGYSIGLYPAYEANNPVDLADKERMAEVLSEIMDEWVFQSDIIVEPLAHILRATCEWKVTPGCSKHHSCPFVIGCANTSVCIEPDGSMFVCMDMAETNKFQIGNAVVGEHDRKVIKKLSKRGLMLDGECMSCPYSKLCHGGCLNHALISGDEYSKSEFCQVWKSLFEKSEQIRIEHGAEKVLSWLEQIGKAKFYC